MMRGLESDARYRAVQGVWNAACSIPGVRPSGFMYMMRELEKACLRTADWDRISDFPFFIRGIEGDL